MEGVFSPEIQAQPQIEADLPYSEQRVKIVDYSDRLVTKNRQELVKEHLEEIDPSLAQWSNRFGPENGQIHDISREEYFDPDFQGEKTEELKPSDMVLVHLTDTFPEDGIIHPTGNYRPQILRDTTHFTVNGPVVAEQRMGVGNWEKRKFAILIPLDKVGNRVENFDTSDTFILGDVKLPSGSLVLGETLNLPSGFNAGEADVAVENFGDTPDSLRNAVYRAILSKGYCPMEQGSYGWSGGWERGWGRHILSEFVEKNGLKSTTSLHSEHWTSSLENASIDLFEAWKEGGEKFSKALAEAKNRSDVMFVGEKEGAYKMPEEYRDRYKELIRKYETGEMGRYLQAHPEAMVKQ